jgi:hypothetical protein
MPQPLTSAVVATFHDMPRHWFWMQVVIVVCILVSMVIAITKLA